MDWKKMGRSAALVAAAGLPAILSKAPHQSDFRSTRTTQPTTNGPTRPSFSPLVTSNPHPLNKDDSKDVGDYIGGHEGKRHKVYDDGKAYATIGIGHQLIPTDKDNFQSLWGDKHDFSKLSTGKDELDDHDIDVLFGHDYVEHRAKTKRFFPDFNDYPTYLKAALVDGVFRGDLSLSNRTRKLINDGDWDGAAREYLDNAEYRSANTKGMSGVATRMEENRDRFLKYAKELAEKRKEFNSKEFD